MTDPVRLRSGDPPNTSPEGTIDVIYDRLSGVAEAQFGDQTNLDGKMVQIFTAASVVMGFGPHDHFHDSRTRRWWPRFSSTRLLPIGLVAVVTGHASSGLKQFRRFVPDLRSGRAG